jgi:hypothetical protein
VRLDIGRWFCHHAGMIDVLWDLKQQGEIEAAQQSASEAQHRSRDAQDLFLQMEKRISRLSLLCQSMWELLRERAEFTDEQLATKVLEVDLRDGRTDGRMATQVTNCPSCSRKTNSKRASCVICGAELPKAHPFEV